MLNIVKKNGMHILIYNHMSAHILSAKLDQIFLNNIHVITRTIRESKSITLHVVMFIMSVVDTNPFIRITVSILFCTL